MTKLVSNGGPQLVAVQVRKEILIETHDEHSEVTHPLHRNHSVIRCHRDVNILRHLQLASELVHDRANSIHVWTWRRLWAGVQTTETNEEQCREVQECHRD
jgi:hypothetical protein